MDEAQAKRHDRWGRRERQDVTMTAVWEDLVARLDRGRAHGDPLRLELPLRVPI